MFCKGNKKKDTGAILLGFATLMFGMETMSGAVAGLGEMPAFRQLFVAFQNPVLGVLAGAVLTALIQSSSASVGILQALAVTGQVSYAAAIPIVMGQNIGTCVTAMISSVGTNRSARRAALVHLMFNIIGTGVWLGAFCVVQGVLHPAFLGESASLFGIAVAHSAFNLLCTVLMLPLSGFLEKLVNRLVPDGKEEEKTAELDERLLATPPLALEQCRAVTGNLAQAAVEALKGGLRALTGLDGKLAEEVRAQEEKTDHYEDLLGTYLVKLSARPLSADDNRQAAKLLRVISDFERIGDHAVNLLRSAEEMGEKELLFTDAARGELSVLTGAVEEILDRSLGAFLADDWEGAVQVEPLEQVIDAEWRQALCGLTCSPTWSGWPTTAPISPAASLTPTATI